MTVKSNLDAFQSTHAKLIENARAGDRDNLLALIDATNTLINSAMTLTNNILVVLDKSVSSGDSAATIAGGQANFSSYRATLTASLSSLHSEQTEVQGIDSTSLAAFQAETEIARKDQILSAAQTDLQKAQNSLTQLNQDLTQKTKEYDTNIANLRGQLTTNTLRLKDLLDGPDATEFSLAKNTIDQANIALDKLIKKRSDYEIRANFDGIVRAIDFTVGDVVSANTLNTNTTVTGNSITVENPNMYRVNVLLDQLDVVKIHTNTQAFITYDAYPDKKFTATVTSINTTPIDNQGVISYEAHIDFVQNDVTLYDTMSANVEIVLSEKPHALVIPALALITENNQTVVQMALPDGTYEKRPVVAGFTNGSETEILSGVQEGDTILNREFKLIEKVEGFRF